MQNEKDGGTKRQKTVTKQKHGKEKKTTKKKNEIKGIKGNIRRQAKK